MGIAENEPILVRIEELRKAMSEVAIREGVSSSESVRMSQQLDQLLNQYRIKKSL